MTIDELFNHITQIVARPDTEITKEHNRKAIQILCCFEDYLIDAWPGYCDDDWDEVDIGDYLGRKLVELEGK